MQIEFTTPSLSDKDARALATRIVKDARSTRVKFGKTNGRIVLHAISRDENVEPTERAFTLTSASDWEVCPLNVRVSRNRDFAEQQPIEAMMAANGTKAA